MRPAVRADSAVTISWVSSSEAATDALVSDARTENGADVKYW